MPAASFKSLLIRELGYMVIPKSGSGSHEWLESSEHPRIRWAFHRREISSIEVRNVLIKQVGLTIEQAKEVVRHG
jgi:hypothetical protein